METSVSGHSKLSRYLINKAFRLWKHFYYRHLLSVKNSWLDPAVLTNSNDTFQGVNALTLKGNNELKMHCARNSAPGARKDACQWQRCSLPSCVNELESPSVLWVFLIAVLVHCCHCQAGLWQLLPCGKSSLTTCRCWVLWKQETLSYFTISCRIVPSFSLNPVHDVPLSLARLDCPGEYSSLKNNHASYTLCQGFTNFRKQ